MKTLGIEKAHLCGLSMGATAGLEFATRHPGNATALVVAAGGGGGSAVEIVDFRYMSFLGRFEPQRSSG